MRVPFAGSSLRILPDLVPLLADAFVIAAPLAFI